MDKVEFKQSKKIEQKSFDFVKFGVNFGLVVVSIFLLYNVFKSIELTTLKLGILKTAQSEVDELRVKNIELILQKETLQSSDYIETAVRNRLNYAENGDILFVIPESTLGVASERLDQILSEKGDTVVSDMSVVEIWYGFLIGGV